MKTFKRIYARMSWVDLALLVPSIIGIAFALSSCSVVEEPRQQVLINSGVYEPAVIEINRPVRLGELVEYQGRNYLVVEIN